VELTKVVGRSTPEKLTREPSIKFDPFTVSVKPGPPITALKGETEVTTGKGFGAGGDAGIVHSMEVPAPDSRLAEAEGLGGSERLLQAYGSGGAIVLRSAIAAENSVSVVELNVAFSLEEDNLKPHGGRRVRTARKAAHISPLNHELAVGSRSTTAQKTFCAPPFTGKRSCQKGATSVTGGERRRRKDLRWQRANMIVAKGVRETYGPIAADENLVKVPPAYAIGNGEVTAATESSPRFKLVPAMFTYEGLRIERIIAAEDFH